MQILTGLDELRRLPGYVYLATPYSKYPDGIEVAYVLACDLSETLKAAGIRHYCPIAMTHVMAQLAGLDPLSHDFWLTVDRPFMAGAAALVVVGMDGWDTSVGIIAERAYFGAAGKPIYFIDPAVLIGESV